jgi:hypothetical protein
MNVLLRVGAWYRVQEVVAEAPDLVEPGAGRSHERVAASATAWVHGKRYANHSDDEHLFTTVS